MIEDQAAFLQDVARLIPEIFRQGFTATAGELWRPQEMQDLYFKQGKTKTHSSNHTKRLAIDLNFFQNGVLVNDVKILAPLGRFWETLNPKNRWGGHFSTIIDGPHFERNTDVP